MKPTSSLALLLLSFTLITACKETPIPIEDSFETIVYEESTEDFPNPERGFYRYSETKASNYQSLSEASLRANRGLTGSSGASYKAYKTLVFRYFILDDFVDQDISQAYLNSVQADFDIARAAGVKVIPRFCYTVDANPGNCQEGFICPPYGDAPKDKVLRHITQLGPVVNENEDVILCLQMGFIGTWGENYYTDYFGDASSNDTVRKVLDENWVDRTDVLKAMLNTFSEGLMVQVRYPQIKQRTIYGINAPTTVAPLTETEAFTGSDKARIGFHNDCLFASGDDFGTYQDYGSSSTPSRGDLPNLKPYFRDDSKYVLVGGETCFDGFSPQNNCAPEGMADTDLRSLHYTYLNADYNNQVNNDWVDGGCMEAIKQNLGYRFVLQEGIYEKELNQAGEFEFKLDLINVGYASITKERPVEFVLRNTSTNEEYSFTLDTDIRKWAEEVKLDMKLDLEGNVPTGEYQCFLFLPDGFESIRERPEYAIQLANPGVWEDTTGYNDLGFILNIL